MVRLFQASYFRYYCLKKFILLQAVQQFQIFQTSASNEEGTTLVDTSSAISVQPLENRKEVQDNVEPPIPKVSLVYNE